jgi:hypothetical protein
VKKVEVTFPDLALIVGTRAMLGAGLALLLADKLPKDQQKSDRVDSHARWSGNDNPACHQFFREEVSAE